MTAIDPLVLEQLSAWMDGELPADEARFLQRRIQNDPALREQWERWQLASACLQREPVKLVDHDMASRVALGIANAANDSPAPRRSSAWLASVAVLALAAVMLPGLLAVDSRAPVTVVAPSLDRTSSVVLAPEALVASPAPVAVADAWPAMSPLPSVRDFPLVDTGGKAWPRSPVLADPSARNGLLILNAGSYLPMRGAPSVPPDAAAGEAGAE